MSAIGATHGFGLTVERDRGAHCMRPSGSAAYQQLRAARMAPLQKMQSDPGAVVEEQCFHLLTS